MYHYLFSSITVINMQINQQPLTIELLNSLQLWYLSLKILIYSQFYYTFYLININLKCLYLFPIFLFYLQNKIYFKDYFFIYDDFKKHVTYKT